ncbi:hypothetical protein [Massilia sp. TWR1-2-2]
MVVIAGLTDCRGMLYRLLRILHDLNGAPKIHYVELEFNIMDITEAG